VSCQRKLNTGNVNWWTIWDKPGWITCPHGQLLYGLYRSACDALSCINEGKCAAACEGTGSTAIVYQIRHCYHDLRWYNKMDQGPVDGSCPGANCVDGYAKCYDDYYVAGLYRSGESLYELQMAKCCSLEGKGTDPIDSDMLPARWAQAAEVNWDDFGAMGPVWAPAVEARSFITGFKRKAYHDLRGFTAATTARFVRGY